MNEGRVMMRGKQVELKKRQAELRIKAKGMLRQLGVTTNPVLQEVEEMDIPLAAAVMDDLVVIQAELLSIRSKLDQLQEALHG